MFRLFQKLQKYLDWTSQYISFELDGSEYYRVTPADHGGFFEWGNFENENPGIDNPWKTGNMMTPFDTQFHLILNLAVGGANDYWSDTFVYDHPKPWKTESQTAPKDFWQGNFFSIKRVEKIIK